MNNKPTIIVTEEQVKAYKRHIFERISPKREAVLIVKDYLDNNFIRQQSDDVDSNGYPIKAYSVTMVDSSKQPIKPMSIKELLLCLDDKFHRIIKDDADRKKFLKQVISDWYHGTISKEGLLSVNSL